MPIEFSGPEVIEMAIQTEKGGRLFYETVAGRTHDHQIRELFHYLAGEEQKHVAAFERIARSMKQTPEELAYNWSDAAAYIRAITESRYFLGEDKALSAVEQLDTGNEVVDHALGFEKETLLFYVELRDMVSEANRPVVETLIAEEKSHIVKLRQLKEAIA